MAADSLPPPSIQAVPEDVLAAAFGRWGWPRIADQLAGRPVLVCVRSRTLVDTGSWFYRRRARLLALPDAVAVAAVGFGDEPGIHWREYPCDEIAASTYNHITGELLIRRGERLEADRFRMGPADGLQLVAQIRMPQGA